MVGKVLTKAEIDKLAREYLHEFPEQREKDIQAIRQWILSQPHLGDKARSGRSDLLLRTQVYSLISGPCWQFL